MYCHLSQGRDETRFPCLPVLSGKGMLFAEDTDHTFKTISLALAVCFLCAKCWCFWDAM